MLNSGGLNTKIHGEGCSNDYYPTVNRTFSMAFRLNALGEIMDVRVAEGKVAMNVAEYNQSAVHTFNGNGGILGSNFVGTLIFLAAYESYVSNGRIAEMFSLAHDFLLARFDAPSAQYSNPFTDILTFQAGVFQ
jgi:hypothetical protein